MNKRIGILPTNEKTPRVTNVYIVNCNSAWNNVASGSTHLDKPTVAGETALAMALFWSNIAKQPGRQIAFVHATHTFVWVGRCPIGYGTCRQRHSAASIIDGNTVQPGCSCAFRIATGTI